MPDSTISLDEHRLEEVRRIMRKYLASWCRYDALTAEEQAAVCEIRASGSAARYPNVAAILNRTDLGKVLTGKSASGLSAAKLWIANVVQVCTMKGIKVKKKKWPALSGKDIETLSGEVLR